MVVREKGWESERGEGAAFIFAQASAGVCQWRALLSAPRFYLTPACAGEIYEKEGKVFGPDAAVGVGVEIPQVATLARSFAEGLSEQLAVDGIHVAVAVGVAEEAEERIDAVAAFQAIAIAVERTAGTRVDLTRADPKLILPVRSEERR